MSHLARSIVGRKRDKKGKGGGRGLGIERGNTFASTPLVRLVLLAPYPRSVRRMFFLHRVPFGSGRGWLSEHSPSGYHVGQLCLLPAQLTTTTTTALNNQPNPSSLACNANPTRIQRKKNPFLYTKKSTPDSSPITYQPTAAPSSSAQTPAAPAQVDKTAPRARPQTPSKS